MVPGAGWGRFRCCSPVRNTLSAAVVRDYFCEVTHILPDTAPRPAATSGQHLLSLAGPPLDAVVPLSFLAAVRTLDLPAIDLETELVHELRNKRFGLSDTVYRQIKRYAEAVSQQQPVAFSDVIALARLVGRRPDADLVFREAGQFVAKAALETLSAPTRRLSRSLPGAMSRPLALRHLRALCSRYLGGTLERQGSTLLLEVRTPLTADAAANGAGCAFYSAALYALMLGLTGRDFPIQDVSCVARGDATCQWRTEWRRT